MDAPLLVRPMQSLAEHRALARNPTWRCYSRTVPLHHVLVAVGSADHIVGYAAVEPVLGQPRALVIAAVKSRQPGAGRALLDTLKAQALLYLLVEIVPAESAAWWRRQGFGEPPTWRPCSAGDAAGDDLAWFRCDDRAYEDVLWAPFWPESNPLGHLLAQG